MISKSKNTFEEVNQHNINTFANVLFVKIFAFVKVFHYYPLQIAHNLLIKKVFVCSMAPCGEEVAKFATSTSPANSSFIALLIQRIFCLTQKRIIIRQISILFPKCSNNAASRKQNELVTDCHCLVLSSWCW